MAERGWYPDPGGKPGHYRFWDGSAWAQDTTTTPGSGAGSTGSSSRGTRGDSDEGEERLSAWQQAQGPLTILLAVAVGLALILFGLQRLGMIGGKEPAPANPTEFCPRPAEGNWSTDPHPDDGRVHGGRLSYPRLQRPWGPPVGDFRVPFGRDVASQSITIETDYRPGQNWVASILVGELVSGDGFVSPEGGMDIVARCIVGAFYGDAPVDRKDVSRKAITVDGHEAYALEMYLSFRIEGLKATGEHAIIVIVATGKNTNSLYYASIPNNAEEYLPTARALVGQLTVGP